MKLMYESEKASFEVEEYINESTGRTQKKYKIKGIYSTPGKKNKNGRVYPMHIWEAQVAKYQEELANGTSNCLMELNHPERSKVDMMEAVAKLEKLYIKDGLVMGEAVLLDNPKANQLKSLIDVGITMAVSSRGVGKVGQGGIVEDFKLITFDVIPDQGQSDYQAQMKGIVEGVLMTEDFDIDENDNIVKVCGKEKCLLENRSTINEAIIAKFEELFGGKSDKQIGEAITDYVYYYRDQLTGVGTDDIKFQFFGKGNTKVMNLNTDSIKALRGYLTYFEKHNRGE